ncbi:MAG: hypothetical protein EOO50_14000 [Flavobacterium sp.]|uniref:hypothetical protein n=1 Tax=Flavobacterium sp. TaxID=239 RepID=UPI0011FB351F|nr:hypothetical protein [Flavobacterium sp.]RZJ65362.1 MAG: hypothetical protein EOO50_14000 [Flavobacterium sp.]
MKTNFFKLVAILICAAFAGCGSDDSATTIIEQPVALVQKMTVKNLFGQPEPQLTGTYVFAYDANKQVTSIAKTITSATGDVVEDVTHSYQYFNNKITSYGFVGQTQLSVLYNSQSQMQNIGFGSDLEYDADGFMVKDSYGIEYVYVNGNPTGTIENPNLYSYDVKRNPFSNHNPYFRIIFEEQFEAYYSTQIFRSLNNVTGEMVEGLTIVHEYEYNTGNLPTKITIKHAGTGEIMEEITYEYVEL